MPIAANLYYFAHDEADEETPQRPPVILIHGAGGNHLSWPPQVRRMPEERVYSLDLPGHGKSEGDTVRQSLDEYVEDVLAFLQKLKIRSAVFAGISMGSAIALTLALKFPRKVKGLCLIGSGAKLRVAPSIMELAANSNTFETAVEMVNENCFSAEASPTLKELSRKQMLEIRPSVFLGDFLACNEFDVSSQLKKIHVPTLILCGAEDKMTPVKYSEFLHDQIAKSKLHIIKDAGHLVMSEQPNLVADLLKEFVDTLPVPIKKTKKERIVFNEEADPAQGTESAVSADTTTDPV